MHARSSTVRGNVESVDAAIAYLRDKVMPAVMGLDGFVGLSMMADRESGRCIATTSWASEAAMHDSEGPLHQLRARYGEILGGRPEVQEWEIAVMHRRRPAPEGACSQVVWMRADPTHLESGMDAFRVSLLSRMEDLPGFCSISILLDREAGQAVSSTVYESRDAMNEAIGMATPMREGFSRQTGVEITEVAEFDLVLAHLRVPETV
jgi:heme-degrading monooxygenase HmoA